METFAWEPAQVIEEEIRFRTLITPFESGKEQRRSKGVPRRVWTMKFSRLKAEGDQIWAFYVARKGVYEAFLWTNPIDGQQYTVRFLEDSLSRTDFYNLAYEFGLKIIEVV